MDGIRWFDIEGNDITPLCIIADAIVCEGTLINGKCRHDESIECIRE